MPAQYTYTKEEIVALLARKHECDEGSIEVSFTDQNYDTIEGVEVKFTVDAPLPD